MLADRVVGWERSVKWRVDGAGQDDQRWVLGFHIEAMPERMLDAVLRELGAPVEVQADLRSRLSQAHFAYLGAEAAGFKAYLEFPVRLRARNAQGRDDWAPPGQWAIAFKWSSHPRRAGPLVRRTEYWLHPGARLVESVARIAAGQPDHPILDGLAALVKLRPLASRDVEALTLYEVRHADGGQAWDVNLYGFHVPIDEVIAAALGWQSIPLEARGAMLGHFAAGHDLEGYAYRSVYWRAPAPL